MSILVNKRTGAQAKSFYSSYPLISVHITILDFYGSTFFSLDLSFSLFSHFYSLFILLTPLSISLSLHLSLSRSSLSLHLHISYSLLFLLRSLPSIISLFSLPLSCVLSVLFSLSFFALSLSIFLTPTLPFKPRRSDYSVSRHNSQIASGKNSNRTFLQEGVFGKCYCN